jgi:o-succinylbenzoate---CoA ligase
MTQVPDWLRRRALTHGDHPALEFAGDVVTFAELDRRAAAYDELLHRRGVAAGDVVATLMQSRPELVALAHGVPRRRRIFAPLGVRLAADEVVAMLESCAAKVLFHEEETREVAAVAARRLPIDCICVDGDSPSGAASNDDGSDDPVDLAATHTVVFTSGTSGAPKGVRLTWGNHLWSAMGSAMNLGLIPGDRWLCCLPLNHVGGLSILMRGVLQGSPVELQRRFAPDAVNTAIRERGATVVSVVANMLQRMLDAGGDRPYPRSLRAVLVGGGPVPAALLERCRAARVPVLHTYGLTETASQVATARPARDDPGVGPPLAFAEIRIVDGDGGIAAPGVAGDIEVRGPMVSPGYLGDGERAAGSWLRTRDRGWLDQRGCLHVLGRGDETIVCGGENVHPAEIERVLETHPAVAEAFAAGVADQRWGAVMHAAVRLVDRAGEAELVAHCRAHLAAFKAPRRIVPVADFPRTPAGKIARREARRLLEITN